MPDLEDGLRWLYGRQEVGIKLGLDNVHAMLEALGDPRRSLQFVHVAGTNGKGTVTTLIADALRRSGHRTGCFTSPHLSHFRERIRVDGEAIDDDSLQALIDKVRPVAEANQATFFEVSFILALLHFQAAGAEWVVLETGLGGRLDATNVVTPALTVITNVARDHVAYLGDSPQEIAAEKAGIMKAGVPLVTGVRGTALQVLKDRSHELQVPMSILGDDLEVQPDINGFRIRSAKGEAFYRLGLAGEHQIENAALVVAAADVLPIQPMALHQALAEATMPGRMELLRYEHAGRHVEVLLDGAHNEAGAGALRRHLANLDWAGFGLIVGFQADKDWPRMLEQWLPITRRGWGVPLRSPRGLDPQRMQAAFGIVPFEAAASAAEALDAAARVADRVVVAGSLWLVGEVRAHILGESAEGIRGDQ